jgi:hypothetical protein
MQPSRACNPRETLLQPPLLPRSIPWRRGSKVRLRGLRPSNFAQHERKRVFVECGGGYKTWLQAPGSWQPAARSMLVLPVETRRTGYVYTNPYLPCVCLALLSGPITGLRHPSLRQFFASCPKIRRGSSHTPPRLSAWSFPSDSPSDSSASPNAIFL